MAIIIRAHYDGKAIIPEGRLDLPPDQPLEVEVRVLSPEAAPTEAKIPVTSLPFFGMWADREDMKDSVAWVNKERRKWSKRLTRRD
ncbi:MAG: hypothetical protein HYX78_11745 [Armatimonadetes bacterium]|nr:hypothetical protein [Armatimonadota bacterium]